MKKAFLVAPLLVGFLNSHAQSIAVVDGKPIDAKEFLWVYKKNHVGNGKPTEQELYDYLQLYIDFKLKVNEARSLQMHTDSAYINEVNGYEQALKEQKKFAVNSPEYRYIINEYRDGVLMFNICEQQIWNKVREDEQILKKHYNEHVATGYQNRPYTDIRGEVVAACQQQLEKDWIKTLRAKYNVKVNNKVLKKLAGL